MVVVQTHAQQLERAKTTNYQIPSDVVSSGGGDGAKSTNYLLDDTIGESNIGFGRSDNYDLNAGYRQPDGGTFLAMGCEDLTTIGTITFTGQATADNTCTVITDNDAGYGLTWSVRTGSGGANTGHLISTTAPHTNTIPPFDAATDGLVGYWKMEETAGGSSVKDYSGNGNNGTPSGAAGGNNMPQPSSAVPLGMNTLDIRSLDFDGTDDQVDAGNGTSLRLTGNAMTMASWVKVDAWPGASSYPALLSKVNGSSPYGGYQINLNGDTGNRFSCGMALNSTWRVRTSASTYATDTWYHVACVYDGAAMTIYVNGVADGSTAYTGAIRDVAANLLLGKNGGGAAYLNGQLNEARVYSRALTSADLQALANTPHTWAVTPAVSAWGARLRSSSTDTDAKWGTDSSTEKWLNIGDGTYPVVTRSSRTSVAGSTQILQFRAEVGASAILPTGVYETTVTLTASSL